MARGSKPGLWSTLLYGALAGGLGAACMTVIRMAARRRGLIEMTVPQAAEEWISQRTGWGAGARPAAHHLADQALHLGYGTALGVGYALLLRGRPARIGLWGVGYGLAIWFGGSWLALPLLKAKQSAWHKSVAENAVDLLAHTVFGLATAVVTEQLQSQPDRGPSSDAHRRLLRVG